MNYVFIAHFECIATNKCTNRILNLLRLFNIIILINKIGDCMPNSNSFNILYTVKTVYYNRTIIEVLGSIYIYYAALYAKEARFKVVCICICTNIELMPI